MKGNALPAAVLGLFIAIGLALGGSYINRAAVSWQSAQRSVTVKGLAERQVAADLALWPLHFKVTGETLRALQEQIDHQAEVVRRFLRQAGFKADEITLTSPAVTDQYANRPANQRASLAHYSAEATMLVRTPNIAAVKKTRPEVGALIADGVLLAPNYNYRTEFLYTHLDRIKPQMIAEATADARAAARQFAQDSGSEVGQIRSASQGYFSISDLDSYTPEIKKIRVVTTINYALED
ncbi:MAG: SIMPL domain-containing protein [Salinisphaera sp.]|uniref:SIMPL domain-containing protein n=1 Tax=Salinisphaera sp. TaxID=1914330 RepID=UPI003C7D7DC8